MPVISYPALLLMESHGLAPNVRSQSFASVKVWSRLYQAGPYFIDLTLGPGDDALQLRGEILSNDDTPVPEAVEVRLVDPRGEVVVADVTAGNFVLRPREAGSYRIELANDELRLTVEELAIG